MPKAIDSSDLQLMNLDEVAKVLRRSVDFVRKEVRAGSLEASVIGGQYLVSRDSVADYIEERRVGNGVGALRGQGLPKSRSAKKSTRRSSK